MQKGKLSAKGGSALGGKTKRKSSKPKRRLAPGWKHGNASLVILIVLVVAIVAGGIGFMLAKKTETSTEVPAAQSEPVAEKQLIAQQSAAQQSIQTAQSIRQDESIVYVDKTYGYQIKLPKDWVGYKVENGAFQLPTTVKSWYETDANGKKTYGYGTVFTISVDSMASYSAMKSECGSYGSSTWHPGCYTDEEILGKNNANVFTVTWPNSGPDVKGDAQFAALADEVGKNSTYLKNNFSLISDSSSASSNKSVTDIVWKKYTNSKNDFGFQYPEDWIISEQYDKNGYANGIIASSKENPAVKISVTIYGIVYKTPKEAFKYIQDITPLKKGIDYKVRDGKLGKNNAVWYFDSQGTGTNNIVVNGRNNVLVVSFPANVETDPIIGKMLATFTLVK